LIIFILLKKVPAEDCVVEGDLGMKWTKMMMMIG